MGKVAAGKLTPEQGRRYIELITAGFDITELPTLIERLEESEDLL